MASGMVQDMMILRVDNSIQRIKLTRTQMILNQKIKTIIIKDP